jgi:hypothetical protein
MSPLCPGLSYHATCPAWRFLTSGGDYGADPAWHPDHPHGPLRCRGLVRQPDRHGHVEGLGIDGLQDPASRRLTERHPTQTQPNSHPDRQFVSHSVIAVNVCAPASTAHTPTARTATNPCRTPARPRIGHRSKRPQQVNPDCLRAGGLRPDLFDNI